MRNSEGTPPLISAIIPAYNEAAVIGRCLTALTSGHSPGELEVLVVCNGCSDDTAEIARQFGSPVRVLETDVPSKTHALNLGDAAALGYPRVYMDADVVMDLTSLRELARTLSQDGFLACSPQPETIFGSNANWVVRAYYRFWMALPYIQEGMITAGVYAISEAGRSRFGPFPDLIADDGYVRLLFQPHERKLVGSAISEVRAPLSLRDLLKIRTRSRLGDLQLWREFPHLARRDLGTKKYGRALMAILSRPRLYAEALPYVFVTVVSRMRALKQFKSMERYVWERDDSSRSSLPVANRPA
ncbi:glycosyltransferase [Phenylobacterium sp.]|jgi:glycosyltransferase involved in cell wall biosynthesis|uniref:glycosyltransferase n=1 Tax=Phenylobacterium sp. TaxID=1871053 RepID=UPI0037C6DEA8